MKGREGARDMGRTITGQILLAVVLSLSLFPVLPGDGEEIPDPSTDPHSYFLHPSSCPLCHGYRGSEREPERILPGTDTLCLGCHSSEGLGITHPLAVRPGDDPRRIRVPADLPLDSGGRMICLTCHRAHGPFLSPTRAFASQKAEKPDAPSGTKPAYRTFYARRSDPVRGFQPLCEGCHGNR